MPQRDRNHELETESQRAFESALPANVVVRPISDDYGIDREVEVFVDGKATGLTFKVQLKGTDKSGTTRRIKRDSLDYWRSLEVPVLLVSYEAKTGTLRGRWVHSIGAEGPDTAAKTLTVQMDPDITIHKTWAARLANDLTLIRTVRRGDVPNPAPIRIEVDDLPLSPSQTTAALLNLSRRTRVRMTTTADLDEAALTITITRRRMQAALPLRVASCSLHLPDDVLDDADPQDVAQLAMILCAGAAGAVNQDCARQWLLGVDPAAPWWAVPGIAERLVPVLAHRETGELLLQIHADLVQADDPMADVYMMPIMDLIREVDAGAFDDYSQRIRNHLPPTWDGGRLAFNLSSLHRIRRNFGTALELLDAAAARAPQYLDDPLYRRFHGACLWEVGRFHDSAQSYRRALDLGMDPHEVLPLLADSLMYAGRYEQARRTLDEWEPNGTVGDKAGVIRLAILDHILATVAVDEQDRIAQDPDLVIDTCRRMQDEASLDHDVLVSLLREIDVLHPLPWMHLIGLQEGGHLSFEAALIAAFLLTSDATAWVLAVVGALETEAEESLLLGIINQARYLCGEDFYDAVWEFARHQEDEQAHFLRELVSEAYVSDPEIFANHVRALDPSKAPWVVDILTYPGEPLPGQP